jgi:hypothetical protein
VAAPINKMPRSHLIRAQTGWSFQTSFDRFQHVFQVSVDRLILKPDYADILLRKVTRPFRVILRSGLREMTGPIKFDNDATFRTIKVDNVRTYARLPAKLLSVELAVFEMLPEHSFRCSSVVSKLFTLRLPGFDVVNTTLLHGERTATSLPY